MLDHSGPARGFGYTVSRAILTQVYGIFSQNSGIKYSVFSFFRYSVYGTEITEKCIVHFSVLLSL